MNDEDARKLIALNNRFYRDNGAAFSRTRKAPWPGWDRVCSHFPASSGRYDILDVACGNMRFERYCRERFPHASLHFTCVDSCAGFGGDEPDASFEHVDVLQRLLDGRGPVSHGGAFDVAVCFGFMHHVPTAALRERLLKALVATLREGGVAAVSFWRFMDDERLARRALETTARGRASVGAALEQGDYLVGWDGLPHEFRYCHSFTQAEIDRLAESVSSEARCLDRFESDGRTKALNGYAVFRRR